MKKVYIDTNIFDYVVLKHQTYGKACKEILDDIGVFLEVYCSFLIPIEIFGSLSEISFTIGAKAIQGFFAFNLHLIEITKNLLLNAAKISEKSKINGYDAIHAAAMKEAKVKIIITENYRDFKKIKGIQIVRPLEYKSWKKGLS